MPREGRSTQANPRQRRAGVVVHHSADGRADWSDAMSEFVWTWNGYRICKRKRGSLANDQATYPAHHPVHGHRAFDTELEAVDAAYRDHTANAKRLQSSADAAVRLAHKWFLRRKKMKTFLAEAARDMKADMYGENGNG